MSDQDRDRPDDGLTEEEAETAVLDLANNWPDAEVSTHVTMDRGRYVMATKYGRDGKRETRTICRGRGKYLILDSNGSPIIETDVFPLLRT